MIHEVQKRAFRKNGVLCETRCYYLRFRYGEMLVDRWKSLGVTNKEVAEKKALEFRQEKEREAAGILEPKVIRESAAKPLPTHLDDYVADLEKRNRAGRNGRGGRQLRMRVTTLLNECSWKVASNISADSFIAWRARQTNGARTLNLYLQAAISFLNWMERMGRLKANPLKFAGKIDERGKSKRERRAFTDDELRRLVAGSGPRGIVYWVAARTGLRQDELRQLIWEDLRLDDAVPFVRVRVVCAKNKKEERVQLIPEIAEVLKAHRPANCLPSDLVFPKGVPRASRIEKDCAAIGIAYRDETGRYADFHALRYTWATFLQRHDVPQRFAMKLMRHSDMKLTAKVYTDETQLPIYEAIKSLPRLGKYTQIRAQISGAEGRNVSQAVATVGGECGEQKADFTSENGASCRLVSLPAPCGEGERAKRFELSTFSLATRCSTN